MDVPRTIDSIDWSVGSAREEVWPGESEYHHALPRGVYAYRGVHHVLAFQRDVALFHNSSAKASAGNRRRQYEEGYPRLVSTSKGHLCGCRGPHHAIRVNDLLDDMLIRAETLDFLSVAPLRRNINRT